MESEIAPVVVAQFASKRYMRLQRPMLLERSRQEVSAMSSVSGKTSNGFAYEGDYQPASAGRVNWTATFRHKGDYAGMRHGCVHGMLGVPAEAVDEAVKADIESTWTDVA
jgi:hypothetical protein